MATRLAFVLCLFVFPAVSLCENQGSAPVVNSTNSSIVYGEIGGALRLVCTTNDPSDTIVWYFNNEPTSLGTEEQLGVLMLSMLRVEDGGWYTCAAANAFGRDEKDFLVVAGQSPVEVLTFNSESVYRVPVGYHAELPCHFVGSPHPTIKWFNGSTGDEIVAVDNRYEVINSTGSLIVHSSNQQTLQFYCTASNMFNTSWSSNFTVEFTGQPSLPITFPLLSSTTQSLPIILPCINPDQPVNSNYTISWFRNLDPVTVVNNGSLVVNQSGYYCCQISNSEIGLSSHFCTTVLNTSAAYPQLNSIEAASISLPLDRNRTVGLLCNGSTPSGYDPPLIEWSDDENNLLTSADDLVVSNGTRGLGYLSSSRAITNQSVFTYTCQGSNTAAGPISTSTTVEYIATCSGNDVLQGGNAELGNQRWTFNGTGARIATVHNEKVFVLEYNGTATAPSIVQTMTISETPFVTVISISGRMRQVNDSTSGVATIQVLVNNEVVISQDNPYPNLRSWQWFGKQLRKPVSNLTVMMMIKNPSIPLSSPITAYFDDLCVTFSNSPPGEGLSLLVIIAIGVGAGCGVLLLLIIIVIVSLCCCCCGKKKGNIKMMKKMSTLIKKKHSAVISELKETEGRYTAKPDAQTANDGQVELYAVADPSPGVRLEESSYASYINPDNYATAANDGQHSARIPSVVVERPAKSTNASQENGVYTSLKPGTREKDNVYQAPSTHPSSTSLHNLVNDVDDDEQYVDVEPRSAGINYMHLMAGDADERIGRSSSHVSRGHSPCPQFPPPLPPSEKQQIYENSQEVVMPSVSSTGAFQHTSSPMHSQSASQLTSPTSLQSGGDNQIYENSQEVVPSSVPMFTAGSLPHTMDGIRSASPRSPVPLPRAVDGIQSASPRSPRLHITAPPLVAGNHDDEQEIYENSEEVMMEGEEDEGDDIYENDIPGMNLHYPNSNQTTGKQYANINT